jgi:tRNA-splicing ligase RtcB
MVQIVDGIPVWGEHDERTLAQIKRCADHESAVGAALMADGHLGYSQPIGGVVAYRDAISPSGVGYDVGCFSGDTRVFTLDGRHPTLAELDGRDVCVLASRDDGEVVPARATARKTRTDAELVRVSLDNGEQITCTPDHEFMLRTGGYRRADALEPGTSLMPLYRVTNDDGYVLVRNNRTKWLVLLHWLVYRAGLLGPGPVLEPGDELVLHHRDFRPSNNDPSNLEPIGKIAHDAMHARLRDASHLGTPEFEAHRRSGIAAFWGRARTDETTMVRRREQAIANGKAGAEASSRAARAGGNGRRGAEQLRRYNAAPARRHGPWVPVACPLCGELCSSPPKLGFHARRAHPEVRLKAWRPGRSVVHQLAGAVNNHKVVSVEWLERREDVYCLEVPGYHNFALLAGVFVHNCGNKAVRTPLRESDVRPDIKPLMDRIFREIPFGIGRAQAVKQEHELFDDPTWRDVRPLGALKQLAQQQLGTVGSGNHYCDVFVDEGGFVWVGVHFGSRGFGHRTASGFLNLAAGRKFDDKAPGESMDQPPTVLPLGSALGQEYLAAMRLAGRYAYAGRDAVVDQVLGILGTHAVEEVHNHHNFCIPGDAIVPTPAGPKRMDEIEAGDTVYAFDPADGLVETEVTRHWRSGKKPTVSITTSNRRLRVSADHPVLTILVDRQAHPTRPRLRQGVGQYVWKKAGDVAVGDVVVCADGYYGRSRAVGMPRARLVGAFLGDGWVRHSAPGVRGHTVGLAISGAGEAHTRRYRELVEAILPPASWRDNTPGAYGLTCSSVAVRREVDVLGVAGRANDKRVPTYAYNLPLDEKLALLAGYVDADGSVAGAATSNSGRATLASTNRELVAGLRELAIGCGLRVTPIRTEPRRSNFGDYVAYRCVLSSDSAARLDLWHDRKASRRHATRFARPQGLEPEKIGYRRLPPGAFAQRVRVVAQGPVEDVYDLSVAHESRSFVCEGVVVHNCWEEVHNGERLMVVRKGATPNRPGQRSFIGGSMGDVSVIVEGVASDEGALSLDSTVHGAGRVMSRRRAAGKYNWKTRTHAGGEVSREMMLEWIGRMGVELRGAGTDESPHVYKRLPDVLAAHASTLKVVHTLRPIGVAMAGEDVVDPYKD